MRQDYGKYTPEDQEVWNILAERQLKNLPGKAYPIYLECLEELSDVLNAEFIPKFTELNEVLTKTYGWSIAVVPGLIPLEQFFKLLKIENSVPLPGYGVKVSLITWRSLICFMIFLATFLY